MMETRVLPLEVVYNVRGKKDADILCEEISKKERLAYCSYVDLEVAAVHMCACSPSRCSINSRGVRTKRSRRMMMIVFSKQWTL